MYHPAVLTVLTSTCLAACADGESNAAVSEEAVDARRTAPDRICEVVEAGMPLPREVRETSGLARSARDPDLFWTHNDAGNEPEIFAVNVAGELVQRVRVTGADLVDWEDLAAAPCGEGSCLYVGDIGDNDGERERITVYRVPEPLAGATETAPAEPLYARFPDGPRDAEALFADGSGNLYVVTKGDPGAIALYRMPAPQRPGETVTLEHVRELFPEPQGDDDRVTGAASTPDGRWVGIRSYRTLYVYPADELVGGGAVEPTVVDLSMLGQAQGESLVLADDGSIWVSSEADGDGELPRWSHLRCDFPDA